MKVRPIARLLLLAPLFAGTTGNAQSLYKWVDDNGRVTYSDQAPVGKVKSQEVFKIGGPTSDGAARAITDQDAQFKKRQDDAAKKQAEATKKEQFEAIRQDSCGRVRGELRALRENVPVTHMDERGGRVMLDDKGRQAESERLESFIEENCSQAGG